jgi:hypothetical protein
MKSVIDTESVLLSDHPKEKTCKLNHGDLGSISVNQCAIFVLLTLFLNWELKNSTQRNKIKNKNKQLEYNNLTGFLYDSHMTMFIKM